MNRHSAIKWVLDNTEDAVWTSPYLYSENNRLVIRVEHLTGSVSYMARDWGKDLYGWIPLYREGD